MLNSFIQIRERHHQIRKRICSPCQLDNMCEFFSEFPQNYVIVQILTFILDVRNVEEEEEGHEGDFLFKLCLVRP